MIPQSLLQAVAQGKQIVAQQAAGGEQGQAGSVASGSPIAVTRLTTQGQPTIKHIQVVATSAATQQALQSGTVTPKQIIISGQPAIQLQAAALQQAAATSANQPPTVTFAIRTASAQPPVSQVLVCLFTSFSLCHL